MAEYRYLSLCGCTGILPVCEDPEKGQGAPRGCFHRGKRLALTPSKYIEFIDHDLEIDYPKEMSRIQQEMKELMQREKESQMMLEEAFKAIGYGIK